MTEFIFVTANDIHICDTNPRARIDNFTDAIFGKLGQIKAVCEKLKADAFLLAGDLYHFKKPERNSHNLNVRLISLFKSFPCPVYMIEGNHDLMENDLGTLDNQALGVLYADGTIHQLRHEVIEKDDLKVSLVGVPYTEGLDLTTVKLPAKDGAVAQICLLHLYAGLKSTMLFNNKIYGYDEIGKLGADIFVIGHYHIDQGIYKQNNQYFVNIGSLSRGTLSEENIDHHPQMGLIRIKSDGNEMSYTLNPIKLKIKPASEVFDLTKKEEEKKESKEIETFINKLSSETSSLESGVTVESAVTNMDMDQAIRDSVMHYIQEALAKRK